MRRTYLLAISMAFLLFAACASSVVPDYGDTGRRDAPIITVDAADRVDVMTSCADFETRCSGVCTDTRVDAMHCGGCGRACPAGLGCVNSVCSRTCPAGQVSCAGVCVNPLSDPVNCGACGRTCEMGLACIMGSCPVRCPAGLTLCSGRCVDFLTDATSCGGCNRVCPSVDGGMAFCGMGACGQRCLPGRTSCGLQCPDLNSDRTNCGGCGRLCPGGTSCLAGQCRVTMAITRYDIMPNASTFTDVCSMPTAVHILAGADDIVGMPFTIPFVFPFFGVPYTTIRPTSNGYVLFGSDPGMVDNAYYPTTGVPDVQRPHPAAFAYNSDLYQRTTRGVCIATVGTAPRRRLIVETEDASLCCGDTSEEHYTFEIVLNEFDGTLDYVYASMVQGMRSMRPFLVGLQNADATFGTMFVHTDMFPPPGIVSGTSLHLTPLP